MAYSPLICPAPVDDYNVAPSDSTRDEVMAKGALIQPAPRKAFAPLIASGWTETRDRKREMTGPLFEVGCDASEPCVRISTRTRRCTCVDGGGEERMRESDLPSPKLDDPCLLRFVKSRRSPPAPSMRAGVGKADAAAISRTRRAGPETADSL